MFIIKRPKSTCRGISSLSSPLNSPNPKSNHQTTVRQDFIRIIFRNPKSMCFSTKICLKHTKSILYTYLMVAKNHVSPHALQRLQLFNNGLFLVHGNGGHLPQGTEVEGHRFIVVLNPGHLFWSNPRDFWVRDTLRFTILEIPRI